MRKITIILSTLLILFLNISAVCADSLDLDTDACILIDSSSGQVLYQQNADLKGLYPASLTKIMTAIVAIENGDLDQVMTASQDAVYDIGKDGMHIGIMPGEQIRLEDLLNALLVRSANETANIIAENICSSRIEFVELMNKRAKELGAADTHFVNPFGAHNKNHYTTAGDMAMIARHAMTLPKFKEIVSKKSYEMPPTNKHSSWDTILYSTNKLLYNDPVELFTVNGIKTGYTNPAGFNLISSAINEQGIELISIVMGVRNAGASEDVFKYSQQLLEFGFTNYSLQTIVLPNQVMKEIVDIVDAKNNTQIALAAQKGLKALLPLDIKNWNIVKKEFILPEIKAPVNHGEVLGYIEYYRNDFFLGRVDVVSYHSIEKSLKAKLSYTLTNIMNNAVFRKVFTIVCIVLVSFIILRIVLRKISKKVNSVKIKR